VAYEAARTKGGDLFTCELVAVLLRQYIAKVRRDEECERRSMTVWSLVGLFFTCC